MLLALTPDIAIGVTDVESADVAVYCTPCHGEDVSPIWNQTIMLLPLVIRLDEGAKFK